MEHFSLYSPPIYPPAEMHAVGCFNDESRLHICQTQVAAEQFNALKCTFYILVAQRRQSIKCTEINKYLIMRMPIKLPLNYLCTDSVRMGLSF